VIGVLQNLLRELHLRFGQSLLEIGHGRALAEVKLGLMLACRVGGTRHARRRGWVPFALVWVRDLGQQGHDVEPGQLVSRLLDQFEAMGKARRSTHILEVGGRQALHVREGRTQVGARRS